MTSMLIGIGLYFFVRCIWTGFFTVNQNERVVLTSFGKAKRFGDATILTTPMAAKLDQEEKTRYNYPVVEVVGPGLHFKWPWEKIYRTSIATRTVEMAFDPETPSANQHGTVLEAVTHDQLNIGLKGQIRYQACEQNLYAILFGIKNPIVHVMGYYVSILRERIANFQKEAKSLNLQPTTDNEEMVSEGVSINDLRKNLREINDIMVRECESSSARYGITLEASLITAIEPPHEVESALAAINTAHNNVSSEISLAKATADQTIVQSKRAVEIETLKAQAEVEPLRALASQLKLLKATGPNVLTSFVRNIKLATFTKANRMIISQDRTER